VHADNVVDWAEEDTELPSGNLHLWEESWDDDEQNDDFSKQLKCVTMNNSGQT
jgi:26 proteasome complex subunit DSS1